MKPIIIFLAVFLQLFSLEANAKRLIAESGKKHVQLVELFSSESCSSCPPADQWISGLKSDAGLWKSFVPVVFHVDYWNDAGWKDGLSSNSMTLRQRDIAKTWSKPSVYTPAVVIDGNEWRQWSTGSIPVVNKTSALSLSVYEEEQNKFEVQIEGLRSLGASEYVVRIAKLAINLDSKITSGENSGRLLHHNFVVIAWSSKTVSSKDSKVNFKLENVKATTTSAVAVWIEKVGSPVPLQAVGGYL